MKNIALLINCTKTFFTPIFLLFSFLGFSQTVFTDNTPGGTETFTVPAGVTSLTVEVWGGGGTGGSRSGSNDAGGGGGGGGYSRSILSVTSGNILNYVVGAGAPSVTGTNGSSGSDSWFKSTGDVLAKGGSSGTSGSVNGANGGATGVGNIVTYTGGKGGSGSNTNRGGGGGSSAGTGANGIDGVNATGGIAPSGGGNGANGPTTGGIGSPGSIPGGGGSGSLRNGTNQASGAGGNGQVKITYTAGSPEMNITGNSNNIADGAPASASYHTDFGTTDTGTPVTKTYTIQNTGTGSLTIGAITLSGTNAGSFSYTNPVSSTVAAGGFTTFTITFNPSAGGPKVAAISIVNDDSDENPYDFALAGNGNNVPEIDIQGNNITIVNGDATPSLTDNTDLGSITVGSPVTKTFKLYNLGGLDLSLGAISFSGADAAMFSASLLSGPITTTSSTTFTVTFTPTSAGVKNAVISIVNGDADENPYTFALTGQGTTTTPEIDILGNSVSIADGDTTPSTGDYTDFGSSNIGTGVAKTYTIKNNGTGSLTIGTITLGDTVNYAVTASPAGSVAAGGTTTFTVTFNPTTGTVLPTTISIITNDADENPYNFALTGTGIGVPEINITGNSTSIADGDSTPSTADYTDFGTTNTGTPVIHTFTIQNTGTGTLTLGELTLGSSTNYSATQPLVSSLAPGGSTTFTVSFIPTTAGTITTSISIKNNDSNEDPYNFDIKGTGTATNEINITGNGTSIPDGSTTTLTTNWTNFGSADYVSETVVKTFTIQNIGGASLSISGYTITGVDAADFSITSTPSATVAAGGSTTIGITFNPSSLGTKTATVTITNNDSNEGTYDFAIEGIGIQTFYDSDGDGVNDNLDIDDDNDGIKDATEESNCNLAGGSKSNYKFLNETFGSGGRTTINTTYAAETNYCYEDGIISAETGSCPDLDEYSLNDGEYTVGPSAQIATWSNGDGVSDIWYAGPDHTGDTNGRMAIFNAATTAGTFYTATITGSLPDLPITYSFWAINLDLQSGRTKPNITVEFRTLANVLITSISTGDIAISVGSSSSNWKQYTASLNLGVSAFKVIFINAANGGTGNDLAIDDISITQTLCDYDSDTIADMFDLDADNDGIPDVVEAGLGQYSSGRAIMAVGSVGTDGLNTNAIASASLPTLDSDGDGIPNYLDLDSDNDSVFDIDESGAGNTNATTGYVNGDGDITGDGKGEGSETELFRPKDANGDGIIEYAGDGILDIFDYGTGVTFSDKFGNLNQGNASGLGPDGVGQYVNYVLDTDSDGIPDYLDITSNGSTYDIANNKLINPSKTLDADNNGILDGSADADKDGILDSFDTNTAVKGSPRDLNTKLLLDFDGRNDYAQDVSVLTGSAGSIMAWIDLNSAFSGTGFIVGQDSFHLRVTSAKKLEVYCNGTVITSVAVLASQRWYHTAAVYNGSNVYLYLNGTKIGTAAASGSIADVSKLTIGRSPGTSTNFFKGKIDEVRVFNVGLTDNQTQRMVYQELDASSTNLKGTYITGKEIGQDLTTSTGGVLTFSNMLRYYRMDTYKDDIIDDLTTAATDVTGTKIYNHKNIYLQQAPMPFVTIADGDLATAVTDTSKDIVGTDVNNYSTIVNIKHNTTSTVDRTDIGLVIDSGKSLTVNGDSGLTNTWWLSLNGKIDLEGKSQLVQNSTSDLDITSSGSIERDQQGTANVYNYNYWSSPVSSISAVSNNHGYFVGGVMKDGINSVYRNINWTGGYNGVPGSSATPVSLARYWLYKFESNAALYANWVQINENSLLRAGQGYTLKGSGAVTNFTFAGKPNNGTITTNTVAPNQLLLVGNPYPSALDGYAFINDNISSVNAVTQGTLYFWEHATNNNTHVLADYLGGYAALNLVGGIGPVVPTGGPPIAGGGISSGKIPKQYIPVGQGFFVVGKPGATGPVIFNNTQRAFVKEDNGNSNTIFRTKAPSKTLDKTNNNAGTLPKYKKIRLGYDNNSGYHRQVLLGFMDDKATSGMDDGYDAQTMDSYGSDMFLLNGSKKLVISGEGYFDANAVYPIGVKAKTQGKVSFILDDSENFDAEQPIYIYDNLTNTYHNIRERKFEIELPAGSDNTRFSLRFKDKTLAVDKKEINEDAVTIVHVQKGNILEINNPSADTIIEKVSLYNSTGQFISSWETENSGQENTKIFLKTVSSGVYIVKVKTTKGDISRKIIIK